VVGLEDSANGRRQFIERLDARARQENDPGFVPIPSDADARTSHLRRGWYWGTTEFAEKVMKQVDGQVNSKRNETYRAGMVSHAHDMDRAEEIMACGLECLGLSKSGLETLPGSDPRKLAIASRISRQTGAKQGWLADRLKMKSAANVSQQLRRLRDENRTVSTGYQTAVDCLSEFFD
jgi:hypothetical protein